MSRRPRASPICHRQIDQASGAISGALRLTKWGRILPEHTTAVSLLDRLLHHAVVVTEGESFRVRQARAEGGGPQPPELSSKT